MSQRTNIPPAVLLGPLVRLALIRSSSRAVGAPSGAQFRDTVRLFAAYQWRREAQIASLIAYAAVCSYAEHILRYELLTWLDRAAAVSLAIVLVRRVGFIPRRCHLAVAALLWATCDILYGNLSRPLYVSLHTCGQRRNHPVDGGAKISAQALACGRLDLRRRTTEG